jgi:hypothetical protein
VDARSRYRVWSGARQYVEAAIIAFPLVFKAALGLLSTRRRDAAESIGKLKPRQRKVIEMVLASHPGKDNGGASSPRLRCGPRMARGKRAIPSFCVRTLAVPAPADSLSRRDDSRTNNLPSERLPGEPGHIQ